MLVKDYTNGGIKMINLTAFINSLKLTWIRRAIHSARILSTIVKYGREDKRSRRKRYYFLSE